MLMQYHPRGHNLFASSSVFVSTLISATENMHIVAMELGNKM
jgi:hypothetical protein